MVDLAHQHLDDLTNLRRIVERRPTHDLKVPPDHGQWGPKLVRDIGEKLALHRHHLIDPIQHGVEGGGKLGNLIIGERTEQAE